MPVFKELLRSLQGVKHKRIGELVTFSSESWEQTADAFGDEFPYIEISAVDINSGEYGVEQVPLFDAPSRAKLVVRENDIIVSTTRPHRGAIAKIKPEHDGFIASTGFSVFRQLTEQIVERDFLYYTLRSSFVLHQFLQRSSGGNYPAITQDELEKVILPLPPLDVQRALVAEMEAARAARQSKLAEAKELLKGMDGFVLAQLGLKLPEEENRLTFAIRLGTARIGRLDVENYRYWQRTKIHCKAIILICHCPKLLKSSWDKRQKAKNITTKKKVYR